MHQVYAPQQLKQRVLAAADCERAARTTAAPVCWKKAALRASAVCCAFALVVGGIAIVGSRHSVVSPAGNSAVNGAAAAKPQNSFDLAVYAAGAANSQRKTVALDVKEFGQGYTFSTGGVDGLDEDKNHLTSDVNFKLHLTCSGSNVKSMEYSLDTAKLNKNEKAYFSKYNGEYLDEKSRKSFVIDYAEQTKQFKDKKYSIFLSAPMTYEEYKIEVNEADKDYQALKANEYLMNELVYRDSQVLRNTRLVLKATFKDGSTQTKKYQIAPVKNYLSIMNQYTDYSLAASREPEGSKKDEMVDKAEKYFDAQTLFTITQVDN